MATITTPEAATLNALLATAGDRLDQIAREHHLSREQIAAMHTARLAAEFLFDLAEGFARGEVAAPMKCSPEMPLAARCAMSKLAELHFGCGVEVAPLADHWRGRDWTAGPFDGQDEAA